MSETKMNTIIPEKMPSMKEEMKTKIYPTFQIDDEDLPELANWKIGDKKMLVLEVEEMGFRGGKEWQGSSQDSKKITATFKILKVGVKKEEFAEEYARKRSNAPRE